ncbi:dTMP kinase [Candidatus Phycosocius spiralis]|uniref:Thymidylate kinase n=1 Tax=Candidatus Phycosocius spiralis TaxID=2815099 RepID=A0ABQ4PSH5_9PROT|nr:dTMP kinase [Candidatus Phycosocius spiralis]GIU65954.1 thymidylate kinase [Candidatus Phycosocius spiralis]
MQAGRFITLEGGEGAGKTTLLTTLQSKLLAKGYEVVVTREPGGTPGAEAIRNLLVTGSAERWSALSELCLFFAAREDHLNRLIRPALARGAFVLCDRFTDSTRVYQGQAGGAGLEAVELLDRLIVGHTQPDLTMILDLDPAIGLKRAAARHGNEDRFESKTLDFHNALRTAYLGLANHFPTRCVVLDAQTKPEALGHVAWELLTKRFVLA